MDEFILISNSERERLLAYEKIVDCRIPIGFADSYEPTDDCYDNGDGTWNISVGAYTLAKNRNFVWRE